MITINNYTLVPTIFPDGTSQCWKLPEELLAEKKVDISWYFEQERELFDLFSFRELYKGFIDLYIPYLPYGRQDKFPSNTSTFNLYTFAKILNTLSFRSITTLDAHSDVAAQCIKNFNNLKADDIIKDVIVRVDPTYVVYPDKGARDRYSKGNSFKHVILFDKIRDQLTGKITGHEIIYEEIDDKTNPKFLIVDDICDGGATFLSMAEKLKQEFGNDIDLNLYVTHGIFSKGRKVLEDVGFKLFTTNSILKNMDGYKV